MLHSPLVSEFRHSVVQCHTINPCSGIVYFELRVHIQCQFALDG